MPQTRVFVESLQFKFLADVSAGGEDKDRTDGHQKNDDHCNAVAGRIVSCRSNHSISSYPETPYLNIYSAFKGQ